MESLEKVWDSGRKASQNLSQSISRNMSKRNWGMEEVFVGSGSRSYRSRRLDDDEEALRWAALAKLPTYDRLRKSLFETPADGGDEQKRYLHKEVDVRKLGPNERQEFVERVFRVAEEDNERFLRKLRNRIDK